MNPNPVNRELASAKLTSVNRLLFSFGVLIMYLKRRKHVSQTSTLQEDDNLHNEGAENDKRSDEEST